jgi:hypothetical protein
MPALPQTGAVEAFRRTQFSEIKEKRLPYGTIFREKQQVVDFLLGYGRYLEKIGFTFEDYDSKTQTVRNWFTAAKEFLFWSTQNWAEGSLLALSPSANRLSLNSTAGVAENLFDSFYDYAVLGSNGTSLTENLINVNRYFQSF